MKGGYNCVCRNGKLVKSGGRDGRGARVALGKHPAEDPANECWHSAS